MNNVSVILSRCDSNGVCIVHVCDKEFPSLRKAWKFANVFRVNGYSIVVRPNYNEHRWTGACFFREWRSVNGERPREVRWNFDEGAWFPLKLLLLVYAVLGKVRRLAA